MKSEGGAAASNALAVSMFQFCCATVAREERAAAVLAALRSCLLEFEQVLRVEGAQSGVLLPSWIPYSETWRNAVQGARTMSQVCTGVCVGRDVRVCVCVRLSAFISPMGYDDGTGS